MPYTRWLAIALLLAAGAIALWYGNDTRRAYARIAGHSTIYIT